MALKYFCLFVSSRHDALRAGLKNRREQRKRKEAKMTKEAEMVNSLEAQLQSILPMDDEEHLQKKPSKRKR